MRQLEVDAGRHFMRSETFPELIVWVDVEAGMCRWHQSPWESLRFAFDGNKAMKIIAEANSLWFSAWDALRRRSGNL